MSEAQFNSKNFSYRIKNASDSPQSYKRAKSHPYRIFLQKSVKLALKAKKPVILHFEGS